MPLPAAPLYIRTLAAPCHRAAPDALLGLPRGRLQGVRGSLPSRPPSACGSPDGGLLRVRRGWHLPAGMPLQRPRGAVGAPALTNGTPGHVSVHPVRHHCEGWARPLRGVRPALPRRPQPYRHAHRTHHRRWSRVRVPPRAPRVQVVLPGRPAAGGLLVASQCPQRFPMKADKHWRSHSVLLPCAVRIHARVARSACVILSRPRHPD